MLGQLVADRSGRMLLGRMVPRAMPLEGDDSRKAIGKRLRALRTVKGLSQDRIADLLEVPSRSKSWNGYEQGRVVIPAPYALALCRIYGVTMDWIYRGLWNAGVPYELSQAIQALEVAERPNANQRRR